MNQYCKIQLLKDFFLTKLHFCDNKLRFNWALRLSFFLFLMLLPVFKVRSQTISPTINYVTGKFEPAQSIDFIKIEKKYARTVEASKKMFLRKETYTQLKKMFTEAAKNGVTLNVLSATRNFDYQKNIWENKWRAYKNEPTDYARSKKILEFSAMPGASRHHWGTEVDLVAVTNSYFEHGEGLKVYKWLQAHAAQFGFCQPYTKNRKAGYNEEKWHWSYLPLAKQYQKFAQTNLTDASFKDFLGAQTAIELQIVKNYIVGINPDCQPN